MAFGSRGELGVSVATREPESYVTVTATAAPPAAVSENAVGSVNGSIEREKAAVTAGTLGTPFAAAAGAIVVTAGAARPAVTVKLQLKGEPTVDWSIAVTDPSIRAV